jgi:ABC-type tungstate transport system substrate-binding protein
MQPMAISAIAVGVVMLIGVSATLVLTRRAMRPRRGSVSRWQLHGSMPLAGAGLALAVISRSSGQSPATHDITFAVATVLLLAALLCALAGAAAAFRAR